MERLFFLSCTLFLATHFAAAQQPSVLPTTSPATTPKGVPAIKTTPVDSLARTLTEQLVSKYTLTADQAKQMYTVQARKVRNLSQIKDLRSTQPALYKSKLQSLQTNTLSSIRRVLNNKAQVELYQKTQADVRTQRAKKREDMLRQHADRASIELAVLEIYAE